MLLTKALYYCPIAKLARPFSHLKQIMMKQGKRGKARRQTKMTIRQFLPLFATFQFAVGLDNGAARTPPMGWLSWERYGCNLDCDKYPNDCVSEDLYLAQAQQLVLGGYRDAGYRFVNVDDCWSEKERNDMGDLVADRKRFPNGMLHLSREIHSLGLLFGLYGDIGSKTCAGYPGFEMHFEQDAKILAEWEVDSIKVDGCNADPVLFNQTYVAFGRALNQTNRTILYNCQWPLYDKASHHGVSPDLLNTQIAKTCNQWRNYHDVFNNWASVRMIIDYWSRESNDDVLVRAAGPGHWNDPDMLVVGNPGLSISEQQAQFALWAIFAAPLFISTDLKEINSDSARILLNEEVIAVNQDPMGHQGYCVTGATSNTRVYVRELLPSNGKACMKGESDTWAVVLVNFMSIFGKKEIEFSPGIHLPNGTTWNSFRARDLIQRKECGTHQKLVVQVDESSIRMFKVTKGAI